MTNTKTRRRYGLEALLEERSEELRDWVNDAPLKLVAAALIDIGGKAKRGVILESLKSLVIDAGYTDNWWWERVRPAIAESKYFRIEKNSEIDLRPLYGVDDIPAEKLRPLPRKSDNGKSATKGNGRASVGLSDWFQWLMVDTKNAPPGRTPPERVLDIAAEALQRRDHWSKGFAKDVWMGMMQGYPATHDFIAALARRLDASHRVQLWREILESALGFWDPDRQDSEIDWLLNILETGERLETLMSLPWWENHLVAERAAQVLGDVIAKPDLKLYDLGIDVLLSVARTQYQDIDKALTTQRISHEAQLDEQRISYEKRLYQQVTLHEKQLSEQKQEEAHLRQQIQTINSMLASKREESRLDIRRDILLAVGEALQLMYQQREHSKVSFRDLEAGLVLALGAGDAQLIEIAGSSVEYNPFLHKLDGEVADGTPVRVSAPGVIVPSSRLGDAVLLKARVSQISGG